VTRNLITDEVWAVIGSLFPPPAATRRPPIGRRTVVEASLASRAGHRDHDWRDDQIAHRPSGRTPD
jgi:hypothetical protein